MKIACLMGTYGRYSLACESLASFLQQTVLADAHLYILNQHPIPLSFDHPNVTVINQEMPRAGVRKIRLRMIELCDPGAEFIHFWDDDDLYLPWHLEDGLRHIGTSPGWMPRRSWMLSQTKGYSYFQSYDASVLYRADVLRAAPTDILPHVSDHPIFRMLIDSGQMGSAEMGALSSYLYRWITGVPHRSAAQRKTGEEYDVQIDEFRQKLVDAGPSEMVVPDLWPHWSAFLEGIRDKVTPREHEEVQARLTLADAMSKLGAGGGT